MDRRSGRRADLGPGGGKPIKLEQTKGVELEQADTGLAPEVPIWTEMDQLNENGQGTKRFDIMFLDNMIGK